jgi:hypothetical protein
MWRKSPAANRKTDKEITMAIKIFSGVVAVILMLVYLTPVMLKLRDPALVLVILVGIALMLFDLWQSLQSKND